MFLQKLSTITKDIGRYERYLGVNKHRRGHKRAINAIARILLSVIFTLLQNGEFFDPSICEEASKRAVFVLSPQQQLERLAVKLGYEIVKVPEPV